VHLPLLDRLFGTFYLPNDRWPTAYGLADGTPIPSGYLRQFAYPFRANRSRAPQSQSSHEHE
jgi:sterol desaturase/sphingolipid hydroxylase (fatty acid hydroxylase superfamily)